MEWGCRLQCFGGGDGLDVMPAIQYNNSICVQWDDATDGVGDSTALPTCIKYVSCRCVTILIALQPPLPTMPLVPKDRDKVTGRAIDERHLRI